MHFIDLCAGIGGFRLGFEKVGFKCVGFCEKDTFAQKSYRAMYDTEGEWFANDLSKLKGEDIPYADIWTAGFPCQDISIAGQQRGITGERSGVFFTIIDLLKSKSEEDKPTFVVFENVRNLLSVSRGRDFLTVLSQLDEAGYDTQWQVFNSKDYGVPQNRERVFIIAHLRSRGRREILFERGENKATTKQVVGGSQGQRVYDPKGVSVSLTSQGGGWGAKTGLYFIDQSTTKVKITENARCLIAKYNAGLVNRTASNSGVLEFKTMLTPLRIRRLTPLECFRLQGFPDELFYKAQAVNSDNQLYKQAGNAVTVNVAQMIGEGIKLRGCVKR